MSNTIFQGGRKKLEQRRDREAPTRLAQMRCSLLCQQRQVVKLTSELLYSWSLLRTNNTAINLQMFTSVCCSRSFATC